MVSEQHLAVPRETAAKLAGLSHRQVDYWASTSLIETTVDNQMSSRRRVRLYGFVDLLALHGTGFRRTADRAALGHDR